MRICVTGWFFDEEFIKILNQIQHKYPVYFICHKPPPFDMGLPFVRRPNVGLEFGAYSFYLRYLWDGVSNIFFTHDDTKISRPEVFDDIATIEHDCAYIFRDWAEEKANGGKHGRAIFCSHRFLSYLSQNDGIWYDKGNAGYTGHSSAAISKRPNREDGSPVDFNEGINHFHRYLGRVRDAKVGLDVVNRVVFSDFEAGRRGTWRHKDREQKRYGKS